MKSRKKRRQRIDTIIDAALSRRIRPAQSASVGGDAGAAGPGCAAAAGI
jgi:hypothetical protein